MKCSQGLGQLPPPLLFVGGAFVGGELFEAGDELAPVGDAARSDLAGNAGSSSCWARWRPTPSRVSSVARSTQVGQGFERGGNAWQAPAPPPEREDARALVEASCRGSGAALTSVVHFFPQVFIHSRLVPFSTGSQPSQYVRIDPDRDLLFHGPIEPADGRILGKPLDLGDIGEVNLVIRSSGESL
jgi:hypothetical protein